MGQDQDNQVPRGPVKRMYVKKEGSWVEVESWEGTEDRGVRLLAVHPSEVSFKHGRQTMLEEMENPFIVDVGTVGSGVRLELAVLADDGQELDRRGVDIVLRDSLQRGGIRAHSSKNSPSPSG